MTKNFDQIETKKEFRKVVKGTDFPTTEESRRFLKKYSENSRNTKKSCLKKYVAYRGMNCHELKEEASKDLERPLTERKYNPEDKLNEFYRFLGKIGYSKHTQTNIVSAVRAFYKFHGYELNGSRINTEKPVSKTKNRVENLTTNKVSRLYNSTTSKRNRALLLFLYQSGQARGQVAELNYGRVSGELEKKEVREGRKPLMIYYEGRKDSGQPYVAFIGRDAIIALRDYLDQRKDKLGRELRDRDPLFAKREIKTATAKEPSYLEEHKKYQEPITPAAVSELLRYLAKNSNVVSEKDLENADFNPIRPHAFRKHYKTALTGNVDRYVVEYTMGHVIKDAESTYVVGSNEFNEKLRGIYKKKIEPLLKVEATSNEQKAVVSPEWNKERRKEIEEKADEIAEKKVEVLEKDMRRGLEEKSEKIQELEKKAESRKEALEDVWDMMVEMEINLMEITGDWGALGERIEKRPMEWVNNMLKDLDKEGTEKMLDEIGISEIGEKKEDDIEKFLERVGVEPKTKEKIMNEIE